MCVYRIDCRDLTRATALSVSENKTLQCARQAFFKKHTSSESSLFSQRYKNKYFDQISVQWIICNYGVYDFILTLIITFIEDLRFKGFICYMLVQLIICC